MTNKNILKNKNCLITGATGGLGKELAVEFAKKDANLFLTARDFKKLDLLKEQIENLPEFHNKVVSESVDLTNIIELQNLFKKIGKIFHNIDVLVNCAGIFPVKELTDYTLKDFDNCFSINVKSPFLLCQKFSQDMIKNRWGRIVNIASSSAYNGFRNTSIYCASKHALLGLSRSIHAELKEHNVRTFCVSPGSIKTSMSKAVLENPDYHTFLDPKEVAKFIVYLISFDNEMISEEIQLNRIGYN